MSGDEGLSRLRAANPVAQEQVDSWVGGDPDPELLARLLLIRASSRRGANVRSWMWRLRRHRAFAVVAVACLCILVAAPAYGIRELFFRSPELHFNSTLRAPPIIQRRFSDLFRGVPSTQMDPRVLPLSTRRVGSLVVGDQLVTLWVAPTAGGGFCEEFSGLGGGCHATRAEPSGPVSGDEQQPWLIDAALVRPSEARYFSVIFGAILSPSAAALEVVYEDGAYDLIPITWVSSPIDAGFFAFDVPLAHRTQGRRPASLTLLDASGSVIARNNEPAQALLVPSAPPPTKTSR